MEDGERPNFLARLAELEDSATPLDDLSGFNYSHGGSVHVTLYRVAPLQLQPSPTVRYPAFVRVCEHAPALDISKKVGNIAAVVVSEMDRHGGTAGQSFTGSQCRSRRW